MNAAPAASRIQLSGAVLAKAQFCPGQSYNVKVTPTGVALSVSDKGQYLVTEHTPGSGAPMAYVPSAIVKKAFGRRPVVVATALRKGVVLVRQQRSATA
jgi:hypothetical protein